MNKKTLLFIPLAIVTTSGSALASHNGLPDDFVNGLSTQIQMGMFDQRAPAAVPQNPVPQQEFVLTPEEEAFINAPLGRGLEELQLTPEEEAFIQSSYGSSEKKSRIGLSEEEQMMLLEALENEPVRPIHNAPHSNNAEGSHPDSEVLNTRGRQDQAYEQALQQDLRKARIAELEAQTGQQLEQVSHHASQLNEAQAQKAQLEEERANHQQRLAQVGGNNPRIQALIDDLTQRIEQQDRNVKAQEALYAAANQMLDYLMQQRDEVDRRK